MLAAAWLGHSRQSAESAPLEQVQVASAESLLRPQRRVWAHCPRGEPLDHAVRLNQNRPANFRVHAQVLLALLCQCPIGHSRWRCVELWQVATFLVCEKLEGVPALLSRRLIPTAVWNWRADAFEPGL